MNNYIKNKSIEAVLNREFSIAKSIELRETYSSYLEELCNIASTVFGRGERSASRVKGNPASLLHLYHHIIQVADGIHVLCNNSCFNASFPLLRSLWEASLSMQYMTEDNFEDRSIAWIVCYYLEKLEEVENLNFQTPKGLEFIKLKESDENLKDWDLGFTDQNQIRKITNNLKNIINKSKYKSVLEKIPKNALKNKSWYSVNNGPLNLKELAIKLNRPIEYEIFFKHSSSITHGKDAGRAVKFFEGRWYIQDIRNKDNGEYIYKLTCKYIFDATIVIMNKIRPDENISNILSDLMQRHRFTNLKK